jgi:hypothetical protein
MRGVAPERFVQSEATRAGVADEIESHLQLLDQKLHMIIGVLPPGLEFPLGSSTQITSRLLLD